MQQFSKKAYTSFANDHALTYTQTLDDSLIEHVIKNAPQKFQLLMRCLCNPRYKGPELKHILLVGKPGCGKTTLAQAIALKSNRTYKLVSGSLIGDRYQNSGSKDLEEAFTQLIQYGKPSVLIIDEVTSFTRTYENNESNDHQDRKTTETLWSMLDKIKNNPNILVIMTTNYPEKIPQQIKTRLDEDPVEVHMPDCEARRKVLEFCLPKSHKCSARDLSIIAWCLKNYSHRETEIIVRRVARLAAIYEEDVTFYHFKTILAEKNIWLSWPWRWIPAMPWPENPKEFLSKVGYCVWQAAPLVLNVVSMYLQYKQAERAHRNAQQQHRDNCNLHREGQEKQQRYHDAQMAQALKFHLESQNKQQLFHEKNMEQAKIQQELQEKSHKLAEEGQSKSSAQAIIAATTTVGTGLGVGVVVWNSMACGAAVGGPIGAAAGTVVGLAIAWFSGKSIL